MKKKMEQKNVCKIVSREKIDETISLIKKIEKLTGKKVIFENKENKFQIKETEDKILLGKNKEKLIVLVQEAMRKLNKINFLLQHTI